MYLDKDNVNLMSIAVSRNNSYSEQLQGLLLSSRSPQLKGWLAPTLPLPSELDTHAQKVACEEHVLDKQARMYSSNG